MDHILSYLQHDKAALKSCSLVCSAWLTPASARLFRSIRWPLCDHSFENESVIPSSCLCRQGWTVFAQMEERLKQSPRLCLNLQHLVLSGQRIAFGPSIAFCDRPARVPDTLFFETFVSILSLLPSLRTLEFVDCRFKVSSSREPTKPVAVRDLDALIFTSTWENQSSGDIRDILKYFRHIGRLVFDRTVTSHFAASPSPSSPNEWHPAVGALELRNHPHAAPTPTLHLTALRANLDTRNLSTLVLGAFSHHFGDSVDAFLRDSVPRLTSLAYNCSGPFRPTIPPNLHLRSLHVSGDTYWPSSDEECPSSWLLMMQLLQETSRPSLDTIVVSITLRPNVHRVLYGHHGSYSSEDNLHFCLGSLDWARLDQVQMLCKGLQKIRIELMTRTMANERKRLPRKVSCAVILQELLQDRLFKATLAMLEAAVL